MNSDDEAAQFVAVLRESFNGAPSVFMTTPGSE